MLENTVFSEVHMFGDRLKALLYLEYYIHIKVIHSQKMYAFVPCTKMNGKVRFHAWFPL